MFLPPTSTRSLSPLEPAPIEMTPSAIRAAEVRKAAEGFEALFMAKIMASARASLPGDDLTGGAGVTMARDMLDEQLAKVAGVRAGFGLADAIARQFAAPDDPA